MRKTLLSCSLLAVLCAAACKKSVDNTTGGKQYMLELPDSVEQYYDYQRIAKQNHKANLGRVLFYDRHLSLNNAVSCGSCHKQVAAFADNAKFSKGFDNRPTLRNSLPIQNLAVTINGTTINAQSSPMSTMVSLFWDGRENQLQNLVARPITNHVEMGITNLEELETRLAELPYYKQLFINAYDDDDITIERISDCIALFMTSIGANNTKFDRATMPQHTEEFTAKEEWGFILFNTKYQCSSCHVLNGGSYMGNVIADIGLDEVYTDKGRGGIASGTDGMFRAPNLRNIVLTAPYMHDGRFATLHDVLDHYSDGIKNSKNLDERLQDTDGKARKMNISEAEKDALIAFLNTLTDHEMVTDPKFSDPFILK